MIELTPALVNFIDPRGRRVTAEKSYLTPEVLKRPNLRVIISATVTKVIFDKTDGQPRAVGVEFTSSHDGPRHRAIASKEVILWWVLRLCSSSIELISFLSAGAVHTPHVGNPLPQASSGLKLVCRF